jgi:hypothetical protein
MRSSMLERVPEGVPGGVSEDSQIWTSREFEVEALGMNEDSLLGKIMSDMVRDDIDDLRRHR